MANNQTLIKLKRYAGTNISDEIIEYGEPFFDKNNGFLYIGTEKGGKSLSAMREAGEYFKWINSKNPVTTSDINTNAVTGDKIAPNVIATGHILNNAIVTSKIADGAVTNSKIADNTITYNKLNLTDKSIPYSKVDAPTSFSANMITGRISADNLPVDYTAPRATGDKYGNDITKNYANHLELETAGGVTRLVLRPLSRYAGDQSNLGAIEPSALARAIQDYLPKQTFDNIGGKISWDQIDPKPTTLNVSSSVGTVSTPIYYDHGSKGFKTCSLDNKYIPKNGLDGEVLMRVPFSGKSISGVKKGDLVFAYFEVYSGSTRKGVFCGTAVWEQGISPIYLWGGDGDSDFDVYINGYSIDKKEYGNKKVEIAGGYYLRAVQ